MTVGIEEVKSKLVALAKECKHDPLLFVQKAFKWGQGSLEGMTGPDIWQTKLLSHIRDEIAKGESVAKVIQAAIAAGHGVGKSGCVAWLILWSICTCADTRGVVTANTDTQLRTKTWAELSKWYNLCRFRIWFELSATSIVSRQKGHDKTWRIDAIPWSENNPEAFAGMHNQGKRLLVIFDEASAIADQIWEVIEGAMTDRDTQILWLAFGNPTRSSGRFFECFNRFRNIWWTMHVDGREAAITNKEVLAKYIETYGIDSDFVKVRVLGEFPSSSDMQFISRNCVREAQERVLPHIPYTRITAIVGVDVARFGGDKSVLCVRFGQDAKSVARQSFSGLDGWQLGAKCAEFHNHLMRMGVGRVIINIDGGGVGASPADWLRKNGYPVNEINFGSGADDPRLYKNKRAEMWGRMKEWLVQGGCIEKDHELETDLTGVEYDYTPTNQIILEKKEDMKKRGLASPDNADALALTFAIKVNEYVDSLPRPELNSNNHRQEIRDPYRR